MAASFVRELTVHTVALPVQSAQLPNLTPLSRWETHAWQWFACSAFPNMLISHPHWRQPPENSRSKHHKFTAGETISPQFKNAQIRIQQGPLYTVDRLLRTKSWTLRYMIPTSAKHTLLSLPMIAFVPPYRSIPVSDMAIWRSGITGYLILRRPNLVVRMSTCIGQIRSSCIDSSKMQFARHIIVSYHNHVHYPKYSVNIDKTAIYIGSKPKRTFHRKGANTVSFRVAGSGKRLGLCALVVFDGTKLPLFVIFKATHWTIMGLKFYRRRFRLLPEICLDGRTRDAQLAWKGTASKVVRRYESP